MCVDGTCERRTTDDDGGTVEPGCEDGDGDGFGEGCSAGPDCDDTSSAQGNREVCDGLDNDCDGVADNGVLSACGNCDPSCVRDGSGAGSDDPFDLEEDESDGVGLDDDGAVVLDSRRINTNFIWIANTPQGTVSRFDTRTYEEVGRYYTGPDGGSNDPSRTSVNSLGDVYVGNRGGNSISRISVLGSDCPDTNGDGSVTSSSGGTDLLAWGSDDCVLWTTELDAAFPGETHVRAVAAQDVEGPDGELRQFVWVGGYDTRLVAKLDGETGEVLLVTAAPARPYGFALDGMGNLWLSTRESPNVLSRIDTTRCVDEASCDVAPCEGEGVGFDECVKQRIPVGFVPYGVTVDFNQRVWIGGDRVARYVPTDPPSSRLQVVDFPWDTIKVHGIAADAEGWIWGAAQLNGVVRMDADNPATWQVVAGTEGQSNKGMAVDADGKIWSITRADRAVVITPGAGIADATVDTNVARSVVTPYTYSDMTGLQLRLATNPRGFYRHVYEACPEGMMTEWGELRWVAETPAGTEVTFRARTADTRAGLDAAEWVTVATVPPDATPGDLAGALADAGVTAGRFIMVEAILRADRSSATEVITPRLISVDVTYSCPTDFG